MKRVLAALMLAAALLAVPSQASADAGYDYRAEFDYGNTHVLVKTEIHRAADGQGYTVKDVRIYAWGGTNRDPSGHDCDGFESDPSVVNKLVAVYKVNSGGVVSGTPFSTATPDLDWGNFCYYKYTFGSLTTNSAGLRVVFDFKARRDFADDKNDTLIINLFANGTHSCPGADECDKLPL